MPHITTLFRLACAAAALCAGSSAQAAGPNLFVNGSFESPGSSYVELGAGSTFITGWTTVLSGVEYFSPSSQGVGAAADGSYVVDLANFTFLTGGGLEQSVATVPGQSYDVSFSAGNSLSSGRTGTGIIKVTLNGVAASTQTFATAVATSATMAWAVRSFSFVATGSSTVVRFWNDQNPNQFFADLDGVSVAASVPEAHSWVMLAAGLVGIGACVRRRRT